MLILSNLELRGTADSSQALLRSYHLSSGYGLFRRITGVNGKYELIVYGSDDNENWKVYDFLYKPTKLKTMPPVAGFHMPRLDWQMWFSALNPSLTSRDSYLHMFVYRLLHNSASVMSLIKSNSFSDSPPQSIKISMIVYEFTKESSSEDWWMTVGSKKSYLKPGTKSSLYIIL